VKEPLENASRELASVIRSLAAEADVKNKLVVGKSNANLLKRSDFVWHELLGSFATMGNSRGAEGLMRTPANYQRVTFPSLLKKRSAQSRLNELRTVLRLAKVRMADKKASWLADAFERIAKAGGPSSVKKIPSISLLQNPNESSEAGQLEFELTRDQLESLLQFEETRGWIVTRVIMTDNTKMSSQSLQNPWDRQPQESHKAFAAFTLYRDLAPDRTLQKVAEELRCSGANVRRWALRWNWRYREREWDIFQDQRAQELQIRERMRMVQRQAQTGMTMAIR
jgi:hypothetical protein